VRPSPSFLLSFSPLDARRRLSFSTQARSRSSRCTADALPLLAEYNLPPDQQYGLKNTSNVVTKRLRWEGFIVSNHDWTEFDKTMPKLVANGEIKFKEHVTKGIDNGEVRSLPSLSLSLFSTRRTSC